MTANATTMLVLAGPTGVGKTAVAVELCERLGGEIVGADSVQVYRGFDIGASKPTPHELRGIRHHLIDVAEPTEDMDAARYAALADAAIADIRARGKLPVVVGGTGLWLRALLRGLLPLPAVDPALRSRLEQEWQALGPTAMHARLGALDPAAAAKIHPNDQLRVVRALEVYEQTGSPLGALRATHALGAPRYRSLTWVLDVPAAHYPDAIRTRAHAMWSAGWPREVQKLLGLYGSGPRALQAVGYRQVLQHLQEGLDEASALEAIVRATLAYAKRQRTWFRSDPSVDAWRCPADAVAEEALAQVRRFVRQGDRETT